MCDSSHAHLARLIDGRLGKGCEGGGKEPPLQCHPPCSRVSPYASRTAPFPHCPLTTAPAGAGRHPPRNPPSPKSILPEIGVHGALVPSHFSIKCRPLSARSGCWAGHTCCPLTGHAVAYDHDHHLFGYVPGLLGPHLSSLFTLPTHCSFTARSHVRRIRPHFHIGRRPRRCRRRGVPDLAVAHPPRRGVPGLAAALLRHRPRAHRRGAPLHNEIHQAQEMEFKKWQ